MRLKVKLKCSAWYKDIHAENALPDKSYKGDTFLSQAYEQMENAQVIANEIAKFRSFFNLIAGLVIAIAAAIGGAAAKRQGHC